MAFLELIENIKKNESFRTRVYKDTLGVDTIGWGFAVKDLVLPRDIGDALLMRLALERMKEADAAFPWLSDMPEIVRDTVIEMCYQLGIEGFSKFVRLIDALKRKDWGHAIAEIMDSKMAKQTPSRARWYASQFRKAKE